MIILDRTGRDLAQRPLMLPRPARPWLACLSLPTRYRQLEYRPLTGPQPGRLVFDAFSPRQL